jgi:hypothetical protein
MTWVQRLKRVFDMDVEICDQCGGGIKVIACIEDPTVIKKILDHMNSKSAVSEKKRLPQSRAPPQGCALFLKCCLIRQGLVHSLSGELLNKEYTRLYSIFAACRGSRFRPVEAIFKGR